MIYKSAASNLAPFDPHKGKKQPAVSTAPVYKTMEPQAQPSDSADASNDANFLEYSWYDLRLSFFTFLSSTLRSSEKYGRREVRQSITPD